MSSGESYSPGKEIGRFELIEALGSGGMGAVFRARDKLMDRLVAIKILQNQDLSDPTARARFEREGVLVSSLSHEHIVIFFAFGLSEESVPYIAMELLEGQSLRKVLSEEGKLDWKRAFHIAIQICEALEHAHEKGIVHRDLKPENIILLDHPDPDFVKVVDFGLAAIMPGAAAEMQTLTATGQLLGSINYMSPELFSGKKADHRTDIYALACMLFECMIGEPPFSADSLMALAYQHSSGCIAENFAKRKKELGISGIPNRFDTVLQKASMRDPDLRYQNIREFRYALEALKEGRTLSSGDAGAASFSAGKNFKLSLMIGVLALFLLSALGAYIVLKSPNSSKSPAIGELPQKNTNIQFQIRQMLNLDSAKDAEIQQLLQDSRLQPCEKAQLYLLKGRFAQKAEAFSSVLDFANGLSMLRECKGVARFVFLEYLDRLGNQLMDSGLPGLAQANAREFCRMYENLPTQGARGRFKTFDYNQNVIRVARALEQGGRTLEANAVLHRDLRTGAQSPEYDLLTLQWDLGQSDIVKTSLESHYRDVECMALMADFFRRRDLLALSKDCIESAKKGMREEAQGKSKFEEDIFQASVKLVMESGKNSEAVGMLEKHAESIKSNSVSDGHLRAAYHNRRLFVIATLAACGQLSTARKWLESYAKDDCPPAEAASLNRLLESTKNEPSDPTARFKYYLEESDHRHTSLEQVFILSCAKEALVKADSSVVSHGPRLKYLYVYLLAFQAYQMPNLEVKICQGIRSLEGSESCILFGTYKGLSAEQFAEIRIMQILAQQGKFGILKDQLAGQEARHTYVPALIAALFELELQANRLDRAEALLHHCRNHESLLKIAAICRSRRQSSLAQQALDKLRQVSSTKTENLLYKIEAAYQGLEFDAERSNFPDEKLGFRYERAEGILKEINIEELELLPIQPPELRDLAFALALTGQTERSEKVMQIVDSIKHAKSDEKSGSKKDAHKVIEE